MRHEEDRAPAPMQSRPDRERRLTDRTSILDAVQACVRDVLDDDAITLKESSAAANVAGWDSLAHMRIILTVERRFNIRFTVDELSELDNVGALVSAVAGNLGQDRPRGSDHGSADLSATTKGSEGA